MKLFKNLLFMGLLALSISGLARAEEEQTEAGAIVAEEATSVEAAAPVEEAAPVEATAEAAPAPVPDKGDTAWMMTSTVLVILMTIPGLALFYGGMVRSKNVLSVLMQVFMTFCLLAILWAIYGYSIAFTEGNAFFGGFGRLFLSGLTPESLAATFSKGVYVPEYVYFVFQLTFACITPCLIAGAFAERMKFSAVMVFMVLWFTFSYLPIAHMVWFWPGPDAFTDTEAAVDALSKSGFVFQKGALDFAGGTVVHINAGVAGLVGAWLIGKRIGYGTISMAPHNLPLVMMGACMLWVGWFGFNVGSNLEATGLATMVFANTLLATAAAALAWSFAEWIGKGTPTMLGAASGAVAGLVAITPACGWVGPMGAIILGVIAGLGCLWAVTSLKKMCGYDDALDAFGVHAIGGIIGAIGVGVFASPALGGTGVWDYVANAVATPYSIMTQVQSQLWGVGTTIIWSGVVAFISYKIVDVLIGLRVTEDVEREGLDTVEHGEHGYSL